MTFSSTWDCYLLLQLEEGQLPQTELGLNEFLLRLRIFPRCLQFSAKWLVQAFILNDAKCIKNFTLFIYSFCNWKLCSWNIIRTLIGGNIYDQSLDVMITT